MPAAGEGGSAAAEVLKGRGSRYNRRKADGKGVQSIRRTSK